jgi:hypothetical protein
MSLAEDLAPYISLFNLLGLAAAIWLLMRLRASPMAPYFSLATWMLVIGTALHALNDYIAPLVGFDTFADDAYDHLFIHVVLLAALIAFAMGVARATRDMASAS